MAAILDLEHIEKAIGAHRSWKIPLREAIQTGKLQEAAGLLGPERELRTLSAGLVQSMME